jgi:hypothetical protein
MTTSFDSNKSIEVRKDEYLAKVLLNWGNLGAEEKQLYINNIYKCYSCNQLFPMWFVSKKTWGSSAFGRLERELQKKEKDCGKYHGIAVCKACFERELSYQPRYFTVNDLMRRIRTNEDIHREITLLLEKIVLEESDENKKLKELMRIIWTNSINLPAEYDIEQSQST